MDSSVQHPCALQRVRTGRGRRIPVSVSLEPETHLLVSRLGRGNRSAGIDELARLYRAKFQIEPAT